MPGFLRQSTASQSRALGPFIDDTDFKTPKTGLTIANTDIKLVVNGGASANKNSGGGTHRVNGVYGVTFDATDTATVGEMEVSVVVTGALPVFDKFFVVEEVVFDRDYVASAIGYVDGATVNATKINSVATTSVTTINANVGTTQPLNFTGTAGSALVKSDTVDIAGAAVSTSSAQIGVNVVSYASGQAPLQPTVAGRTLDVSATGEGGVDWANVGSPTTTVGLTGTTISSSQVVASVTAGVTLAAAAVQAVWDALTSALTTSGSIGKLLVDNINATISSRMATYTQPTGFLAATFPSGTIANTTNITAGTITTVSGNVSGNVTGSVGSVASGGITAASIASNAITSAKIATDAIGAAQLAADAVTEIWDEQVDGTVTARKSLRLANSANGGKLSGAATTTVDIRDLADTKNRVVATVDSSGNRTAVTLDLT